LNSSSGIGACVPEVKKAISSVTPLYLSVLAFDFYFAKPYHSWERGANENTNGLIRQYFTKGWSFENITNQDVKRVQDILNNRPEKN
jgi:IS30 family transposase